MEKLQLCVVCFKQAEEAEEMVDEKDAEKPTHTVAAAASASKAKDATPKSAPKKVTNKLM